ncbi:MAG TPA: CidA/LrgA family protein [Terrimicrobiaceae bacterium]
MKRFFSRSVRHARFHFRRRWWIQALALFALWALCEAFVGTLHVPVPGSIVGLGVLLLTLELRWISADWFQRGASGLLGNFILFLIPTMLAVVNHRELVSLAGLKLLVVVMIGTLLVMISTAAVVEVGFRLQSRCGR